MLVVPDSEEDKVARKARYDATRAMIREIAASQLLREELAKSNPNLVSVSSFMNKVCGVGQSAQMLKETAEMFIKKAIAGKVPSERLKLKETTLGQGAVFGQTEDILISSPITGSLEHGEFAKNNVAAFALGKPQDPATSTVFVTGDACEISVNVIETVTDQPDDRSLANDGTVRVGDVEAHGIDESDAISLDDTVMSIGESSSEESTALSTCGSSASVSETRKCAADESPDREREGSSRRDFPGRVTRSAAGCRVYIPPMFDDKSDCPGRILNDDGTCNTRITVGQSSGDAIEGEGEILLMTAATDGIVGFAQTRETDDNPGSSSGRLPVAPVGDVLSIPEPFIEPTVTLDNL